MSRRKREEKPFLHIGRKYSLSALCGKTTGHAIDPDVSLGDEWATCISCKECRRLWIDAMKREEARS